MCPNGETCINTDGSFFCRKPCDGLVEELELVSGNFKQNIFSQKTSKILEYINVTLCKMKN